MVSPISDLSAGVLARPILLPKLSVTSSSYLQRTKLSNDKYLALQAVAQNNDKENNRRTFTVFLRLPPELRDKIWQWYALMCPRLVNPAMSPWNIDILLLNDKALRANYLDEELVCEMLAKANIHDKVRFIVLEAPWNRRSAWLATFKRYTELEVVLVVVETCDGREGSNLVQFEPFDATDGRNFRYQLLRADDEDTRPWEKNNKPVPVYRAELERHAMKVINIDEEGKKGRYRVAPTVLLARHIWIDQILESAAHIK